MRSGSSARGYAMVALLVALSVMSIMLTVALPTWRQMVQREKEVELVFRGELMPCDAPGFEIPYPYTQNDVRELPEVARYAPRLGDALDYLNDAIEPLHQCGVIAADVVVKARNGATNARIIYSETLKALALTEEQIR